MPIRRRKYHGVYYHSSPPRVFPMNSQQKQKLRDNGTVKEAIVIKPSNIRIWIHDKDIGKLTQVLWEGQGNRLRTEICSNNRVKKFLDAVPYVMNVIKDVHTCVIENDLDGLTARTATPVPKVLLSCKDANGLSPLHKAAGLNRLEIVEYLLSLWPASTTESDASGKMPLHWAASPEIFNRLVQAGADEQACDYRMKTANFYKSRPSELDKSLLTVIPDAPRVPQPSLQSNYDWSIFNDKSSQNSSNSNNNFLKKSHSTYDSFIKLKDEGDDELRHSSTSELSKIGKENSIEADFIAAHSLSAEEASIIAENGVENYLKYRNSIESKLVTADDEHENGDAEAVDIMGTAESAETAETAETTKTGEIEINGNETADEEQNNTEIKNEETDTNQETAEPAEADNEAENNIANDDNDVEVKAENSETEDDIVYGKLESIDTPLSSKSAKSMRSTTSAKSLRSTTSAKSIRSEKSSRSITSAHVDATNDDDEIEIVELRDENTGNLENDEQVKENENDGDVGKSDILIINHDDVKNILIDEINAGSDAIEDDENLVLNGSAKSVNGTEERNGSANNNNDEEDVEEENGIEDIENSNEDIVNDAMELEQGVEATETVEDVEQVAYVPTEQEIVNIDDMSPPSMHGSAMSRISLRSGEKSMPGSTHVTPRGVTSQTQTARSQLQSGKSQQSIRPASARSQTGNANIQQSLPNSATPTPRHGSASSQLSRHTVDEAVGSAISRKSVKSENMTAPPTPPSTHSHRSNSARSTKSAISQSAVVSNAEAEDAAVADETVLNDEIETDATAEAEYREPNNVDNEADVASTDVINEDKDESPPADGYNSVSEPPEIEAETRDEANLHSPALEIEGIVQGEPDNNIVQSGGSYTQDESMEKNALAAIDMRDMEQLADMVLNGDGQFLIGTKSDQPEIQAFLDNVPVYMNKIRRIHLAAREGSLRELQSALDRRKFAIAKDDISPNKCTPLHVAAVFGYAAILRYLGGRFPETTSAVDENGRTALHYAATIKDNGHFYNVLVQMGANPKAIDKTGHAAEFYLNHEESYSILSHAELLKGFGANVNLANDMLSDQDRRANNQVEIPLFRTEEGRYLASTLGDPLIKGLTEVANNRPTDPVLFLAEYLQLISKEKKISPKKVVEKLPKMDFSRIDSPTTEDAPPNSNMSEPAANSDDRDEHGQSVLHFACARSHGRNALIQLIDETGVSLAYRDELYRTARDVSMQATQPENTREIDKYVLSLAARGEIDMLKHLVIEGYDHIVDIHDDEPISMIAKARGHTELATFLEKIPEFESKREKLHRAVRSGDSDEVKRIIESSDGQHVAMGKNYFGRTALHIAVLKEKEDLVHYLATKIKPLLRLGDNLERTALHYAMGVNSVESLSRILIKNGAKRVLKDLKGRQPSYYFMNKSDIMRLQEEEEEDEL